MMVIFRFLSGNEHNLLILNQTSGELKLSTKLDNDREFSTEFNIEVTGIFIYNNPQIHFNNQIY